MGTQTRTLSQLTPYALSHEIVTLTASFLRLRLFLLKSLGRILRHGISGGNGGACPSAGALSHS